MKKPIYKWECLKCKKRFFSSSVTLKHCDVLMVWVDGILGKGIQDMKSPKVRIKVSGWIELSRENLDTLLSHKDPHRGIVFSIPMAYVDTKALEFDLPE